MCVSCEVWERGYMGGYECMCYVKYERYYTGVLYVCPVRCEEVIGVSYHVYVCVMGDVCVYMYATCCVCVCVK